MFKQLVQKFFSYEYLLGQPTVTLARTDYYLYYVGAVLLGLGIILFFVQRIQKNPIRRGLLARWSSLTFWVGVMLAAWFWLRYELVAFFSLHIVAVAIVATAIIWAIYILKYQFGMYRLKLQEFQQDQLKKRYM